MTCGACLCIRKEESEEVVDNLWLPDPNNSSRSDSILCSPVSKTSTESLDGELVFSPNVELVFYEKTEYTAPFSKASQLTLRNQLDLRSPKEQLMTPRVMYPTEYLKNKTVDKAGAPCPSSNGQRAVIRIPEEIRMPQVDWGYDTVELDTESAEESNPSVIFTPCRIRSKHSPIESGRIWLQQFEPRQSIIKRSKETQQMRECWTMPALVPYESAIDYFTPLQLHSDCSDLEAANLSFHNSLYTSESTDREYWATFVPLTPEKGDHTSSSSTVHSSSKASNSELKILNSHQQDEETKKKMERKLSRF